MVTPVANTTRKSGLDYPLFHSLLKEGRMSDPSKADLVCPKTAPVLISLTEQSNVSETGSRNMDHGNTQTGSIAISEEKPIALKDPPKCKLKRQLSIETTERTEADRITKRHISCYPGQQTGTGNKVSSDEVDGFTENLKYSDSSDEKKVLTAKQSEDVIKSSPQPGQYGQQQRKSSTIITAPELATAKFRHFEMSTAHTQSLDDQLEKHSSNVFSQKRSEHTSQGLTFRSCSSEYRECRSQDEYKQNLISPVTFNLHDMCQTSPFISTTPTLQKSKENNIFIFPEQSTPKKISPYAQPTEQPETSTPLQRSNTPSRFSHKTCSPYENDRSGDYSSRQMPTERNIESEESPGINLPPHVSPKGFIWPKTPNLNRYPPYSPKPGPSETKHVLPTYGESKSRGINRYDGCEEDYAKLCMLKREYTRAMQNYGIPTREPAPFRSRDIDDIIRRDRYKSQRSAEERSPNEKAIHEIQEEVQNRYERSFSDPLYNPLHHRHLLRQASRLARERIMEFENERKQEVMQADLRRDSWYQDYRKRLFMKGDPYRQRLLDHQKTTADSEFQYGSGTEIPHEVLDFLHSLNFHPEELENLKDYIRRGASECSTYCQASNSGHTDGQGEFLQPPETEGLKRSPNSKGGLDLRQRQRECQLGDLNIRVSCGGFKEKAECQPEVDNDARDCKCERIENEIRAMAMGAYSKIRGMKEFHETNVNVSDSMNVLRHIKTLCSHGRTIEDIYSGSVVFTINCPDIDALLDLWTMYKSGALSRIMRAAFVTDELKEKFECEDIDLKVHISKEEYLTCKNKLESLFQKRFLGSNQSSPSIVHTRSRSEPASVPTHGSLPQSARLAMSPFRERICSDSSMELSPRRAFQEINTRDVPRDVPRDIPRDQLLPPYPLSPSKKFVSDNVFYSGDDSPRSPLASISPLTSPRRKSFGTKFQFTENQQQENVDKAPDTKPTTSGTTV